MPWVGAFIYLSSLAVLSFSSLVAGFARAKFEVASLCSTSHCSDASGELVHHSAIVGSALCWVLPCLDDFAMFYLGD